MWWTCSKIEEKNLDFINMQKRSINKYIKSGLLFKSSDDYLLSANAYRDKEINAKLEKCHVLVVRDTFLWWRKSMEGNGFESGLHNLTTRKLSLSTKQ